VGRTLDDLDGPIGEEIGQARFVDARQVALGSFLIENAGGEIDGERDLLTLAGFDAIEATVIGVVPGEVVDVIDPLRLFLVRRCGGFHSMMAGALTGNVSSRFTFSRLATSVPNDRMVRALPSGTMACTYWRKRAVRNVS